MSLRFKAASVAAFVDDWAGWRAVGKAVGFGFVKLETEEVLRWWERVGDWRVVGRVGVCGGNGDLCLRFILPSSSLRFCGVIGDTEDREASCRRSSGWIRVSKLRRVDMWR
jgi:hypothetical protein